MKISVITITLNRRDMLKRAIESVLQQNYANFEHIIIDGASTDGTVEMLKEYPHLICISEPDSGQANAMNKGVRLMTGDVFAWLNSDDYYTPKAFNTVAQHFAKSDKLGMVYGCCNIVDAQGKIMSRSNYHPFDLKRIEMGFNNVNTPTLFFSSKALKASGQFDEALCATYDVDMIIRIARQFGVLAIPDIVTNLCLHSGSGLVATQKHFAELKKLSEKYWNGKSVWDRFFRYPCLALSNYLYKQFKFSSLANKVR